MNVDQSRDTAFADLVASSIDLATAAAATGPTAPVVWIALSDAQTVRVLAHEMQRRGWRIGLATTRVFPLLQADATRMDDWPTLIIAGIRFVDGDGFQLIRRLPGWPVAPALMMITHQQRAVIRAALSLAQQLKLRAVECVELPCAHTTIAARAHALAEQAAQRPPAAPALPPLERSVLQDLLDGDRIVPFLQPKMRLDSDEIVGFEALMRGLDRDGQVIGPDRLIEPLMAHGLLGRATLHMARHTLGFVADCLRHGQPAGASLNVSLSLMADTTFCAALLRIVDQSGVDPSWITLEITESEAMSDPAGVIEQAGRIRMYGFNLSIDDFGTAYSSFFQLSQIPFSELKIERAFVGGLDRDRTRRAIVAACAQLGRALDLNVVAEGVETPEDLACVIDLGCTAAQGYLLSHPLPAADAVQWLLRTMAERDLQQLAA